MDQYFPVGRSKSIKSKSIAPKCKQQLHPKRNEPAGRDFPVVLEDHFARSAQISRNFLSGIFPFHSIPYQFFSEMFGRIDNAHVFPELMTSFSKKAELDMYLDLPCHAKGDHAMPLTRH